MPAPLKDSLRIAIIGSGAVGCYYGGRLAQHGHDVHFLMRSDLETVKRHGLRVKSWQGDFHLPTVQGYPETAEIGPCDLVIVALKTTANEQLPHLLPPLLHEQSLILTLQNGLGSDDYLAHCFGSSRVLGGLCFVCINRTAPGVIEHLAQGAISMGEHSGPAQPRTHALAEKLRACAISCGVEENLLTARWKKLVWNIPFNGLSIAAGSVDTATILATPALEQRVRELMQEIIATAGKLGHALPSGLMDDMIERTRSMAGYKPSSLIDFLDGREVELDTIWGEPLLRARAAGLEMPKLAQLYEELRVCLSQ